VLLLEPELLGGEETPRFFVLTFVNACIGTFADLLEEIVFLEKGVEGRAK